MYAITLSLNVCFVSIYWFLFHVTKKLLNLPSHSKIDFCDHAPLVVSQWLFTTAFCLINMVVLWIFLVSFMVVVYSRFWMMIFYYFNREEHAFKSSFRYQL